MPTLVRIQLLADRQYFLAFSTYLSEISDIELTEDTPDIIFDASFLDPAAKLKSLSAIATAPLIVSNSLTLSATKAQHAVGDRSRVVGMPILPHYFERQKTIEFAMPLGADDSEDVSTFLTLLGKTGEQTGDAIGGVFPRTLAMIINEAAFAVQESVALPADIDLAMKLGTSYPKGPLAWCDEIGAEAIVAVLDALGREYGPERYRVASILRRYSEAGMKFFPA